MKAIRVHLQRKLVNNEYGYLIKFGYINNWVWRCSLLFLSFVPTTSNGSINWKYVPAIFLYFWRIFVGERLKNKDKLTQRIFEQLVKRIHSPYLLFILFIVRIVSLFRQKYIDVCVCVWFRQVIKEVINTHKICNKIGQIVLAYDHVGWLVGWFMEPLTGH